jgi:hypothetical protein
MLIGKMLALGHERTAGHEEPHGPSGACRKDYFISFPERFEDLLFRFSIEFHLGGVEHLDVMKEVTKL